MEGYTLPLEQATKDNVDFRRVLYTGHYSQLVLMSLQPGEDIGTEAHGGDQFFRFEAGTGEVMLDGKKHAVKGGDAVVIPAGTEHNITNVSNEEPLKLYTIYSPPQHADGVVSKTKASAEQDDKPFEGKTSED